jgi:hypothetical protein
VFDAVLILNSSHSTCPNFPSETGTETVVPQNQLLWGFSWFSCILHGKCDSKDTAVASVHEHHTIRTYKRHQSTDPHTLEFRTGIKVGVPE